MWLLAPPASPPSSERGSGKSAERLLICRPWWWPGASIWSPAGTHSVLLTLYSRYGLGNQRGRRWVTCWSKSAQNMGRGM